MSNMCLMGIELVSHSRVSYLYAPQ